MPPPTEPLDSPDLDSSDSDLELDISELASSSSAAASSSKPRDFHQHSSIAAALTPAPRTTSPSTSSTGPAPLDKPPARIALRNLRMGGPRRSARSAGVGVLGTDGEGASDPRRGSSEENVRDDEAPLLDVGQRRSFGQTRKPPLSDVGFRARIPFFGRFLRGRAMQQRLRHDYHLQRHDDDEVNEDPSAARLVTVGSSQMTRFPSNIISNAKYTAFTFLPVTLYNEFSFFFNMYFLLVALSQIIPALRIGYLTTYLAPLVFVLVITMGKEAFDDIARRKRDNEANSEEYTVLQFEEGDGTALGGPVGRKSNKMLKSEVLRKGRRSRPTRERLSDIREEEEELDGDDEDDGDGDGDGEGDGRWPLVPSSIVYEVSRKSKDLEVGHVLKLSKGQRVPADVVILKCYGEAATAAAASSEQEPGEPTSLIDIGSHHGDSVKGKGKGRDDDKQEQRQQQQQQQQQSAGSSGETFIRTDQLDGETDWKLRLAPPLSQNLATEEFLRLRVTGGKPDRRVNEFIGAIELLPRPRRSAQHKGASHDASMPRSLPLNVDNTSWANTVIASQATTLAVIIYTGTQTRSALSTAASRSKTGLLEYEINSLTKILCFLTLTLSIILVALEGFESTTGNVWYVKMMRFLILFSTIVPISLRVNLDMGKSAYSYFIQHDGDMPGAVVRTSTIPEELGRIEYLLSDKTGTLTQNEMEMKKIHVGTVSYANEAMDEVASYVRQGFAAHPAIHPTAADPASHTPLVTPSSTPAAAANTGTARARREIGTRVRDVVLALALCHNVTPTTDQDDETGHTVTSYQASSPDEIAILRWTESVGLRLRSRDRHSMMLESTATGQPVVRVRILDLFPFTSEGKRMGIIVQFWQDSGAPPTTPDEGEIWFYQKGADTVMGSIVAANDWLDEETANMAREGLRTLVVGRKRLSPEQYSLFSAARSEASLAMAGRDAGMQLVVSQHLEHHLELLGVTGVEDRLQRDVKPSLELLRNAGIKIWMLTGDKVETARCVAVSSKLVARGQYIYTVAKLHRKENAVEHLDFLRSKPDACLLVDGESLALLLTHFRLDFISIAVRLPTVVACRCSPTQKAELAMLIREHTRKRICCIGDGGNDVSMIQAADVGVGIVGKEGRQASLAADFSIEQFCHLTKLLVWHGRNSYKRSAKLAQFVIHRGLIMAVCQAVYSIALRFEPEGLYKDWLMVGYATIYTAAPVLSLILDKDVDEELANLYPELYKELTSGRSLSYRTFFVWALVSIYQGSMIQGLAQILTEVDSPRMVAVSFTSLVLNELLMVAVEITTWHPVMIASIVATFVLYFGSIPFLGGYFDLAFLITWGFVWRALAITSISLVPPYAVKVIRRTMKPPSYRKVQSS